MIMLLAPVLKRRNVLTVLYWMYSAEDATLASLRRAPYTTAFHFCVPKDLIKCTTIRASSLKLLLGRSPLCRHALGAYNCDVRSVIHRRVVPTGS